MGKFIGDISKEPKLFNHYCKFCVGSGHTAFGLRKIGLNN